MPSPAISPPQTAAAGLFRFASELIAALLLRRAIFDQAVRDPAAWRNAAVVVIFAAAAADSLGLYSDLDVFLVRGLVNWSLLPIMLLAIARWSAATAVALAVARILGERMSYGALWRPAGYGYAPATVMMLPALLYSLDLTPVTASMVWTIRWLALPWTVAALTLAARAAGAANVGRAVAIGAVLFVAANVFDVLLDFLLLLMLGVSGGAPPPPTDAVL